MIKMYWEQEEYKLDLENEFTPLELLESLGAQGREVLVDILLINYRDATKSRINQIESFEKANFLEKI